MAAVDAKPEGIEADDGAQEGESGDVSLAELVAGLDRKPGKPVAGPTMGELAEAVFAEIDRVAIRHAGIWEGLKLGCSFDFGFEHDSEAVAMRAARLELDEAIRSMEGLRSALWHWFESFGDCRYLALGDEAFDAACQVSEQAKQLHYTGVIFTVEGALAFLAQQEDPGRILRDLERGRLERLQRAADRLREEARSRRETPETANAGDDEGDAEPGEPKSLFITIGNAVEEEVLDSFTLTIGPNRYDGLVGELLAVISKQAACYAGWLRGQAGTPTARGDGPSARESKNSAPVKVDEELAGVNDG
jgi:hypothetical protein